MSITSSDIRAATSGSWAVTVREITDTDGYTVSYGEDKETHRTTITNSHTPATVDIPVTKIWSDADDQDGRRPGEITVSLLANGKVVRTQKLSAGQADKEGSWTYTFTGLPEKENGQKIIYTVTEEKVTGYETAVTTERMASLLPTAIHRRRQKSMVPRHGTIMKIRKMQDLTALPSEYLTEIRR